MPAGTAGQPEIEGLGETARILTPYHLGEAGPPPECSFWPSGGKNSHLKKALKHVFSCTFFLTLQYSLDSTVEPCFYLKCWYFVHYGFLHSFYFFNTALKYDLFWLLKGFFGTPLNFVSQIDEYLSHLTLIPALVVGNIMLLVFSFGHKWSKSKGKEREIQ